MAPAAWRERAETSLALNHRFSPQKPTAILMAFKIMVGVIFFHLPAIVMNQNSKVDGGAL